MATVKTPLVRKLQKLLTQEFPSPATVKLESHDGVIGVVTSERFSGMDTVDRQQWIGQIIDDHLTADERRQVQVIVAVTPQEGTGYLASVD